MKIKSNEIKVVETSSIVPNPKNMNKHSSEQIQKLCDLIKHNGFRDPLIVSNRSGFLICGHGRLEAAKILGMKKIPVIFQDFENEAEEYQFAVSHNAIASWSELDRDLIKLEIENFGLDLDFLGIRDFIVSPAEVDLPKLNSSDPEFQQVTFTLSNEQKDLLDEAMKKAKKEEDYADELNQNKNGNILTAIVKKYVCS